MPIFKVIFVFLLVLLQACANPSIVNIKQDEASNIPSGAVIFVPRFEGNPNFVEESTDYFVSLLEAKLDNRIAQGSVLRHESTDIQSGANLAPEEVALELARVKGYDVLVMGKVTSHKTWGSLNGFSTIRIYDVRSGKRIANFHRPSGLLMAHSEHQCVMAAVKRTAEDATPLF
ncbi:hypothetical protein [Pollutimonas thiosulfatoxidans]|uniref:FlgO domain-containing protein n=1 Tax=Pollutimonas thiosulfatoxidans TaxID=2028345 RepID=A0A410GDS9_9BURK|nr:hypothetical protein [Pollutimonas thiosulfatoxidans]QAA94451.1 hypothetical protein CKA81_11875 [Pollutimonas thiosulfatoxidans]